MEPIDSFLLRPPAGVYATFLGVAFASILLAVAFASGAVDVDVSRWLWLIDLGIVVSFPVDHLRVAVSRGRTPKGSTLFVALAIAGALIALTLFVCWT
jgi:uncharacterized membrane protein